MTTLYESFATTNSDGAFYGVNWYAQSFLVGSSAHTVTSVKIYLKRYGSPGTITLSIRAVDGNLHPTGSDLASGTTNGNTLPTSGYEQREITLSAEVTLSANTTYAIVVRATSANSTNVAYWRSNFQTPNGGYATGEWNESYDSGVTWYFQPYEDFDFEIWGNPASTPINVSDSGTGADTSSIALSVAESGVGTESDLKIGPLGTDAGVGVEAVTTGATMTVADAGASVDSPAIEGDISGSDSGVGAEASLSVQAQLTETDAGLGSESPGIAASVPVSESGAGLDTPGVQASIPISDSGVGSEAVTPTAAFTVTDSGVLSNESVTTPGTLIVSDEGKGAEFAWRIKPSNPMIDDLVLPHVLAIIISDLATMSDKKVQGGSLPRRKMVGKPGRTVEIQGWSDDQTEIDAVDALRDGAHHTFYPQSGDSFGVLVTDFQPSRTVDEYNRRTYRLSLVEAN